MSESIRYDHYLLAVEARGKFTKEAIFAGLDAATRWRSSSTRTVI